jgi:two-component system sensor histidine kinase BarA
MKIILSSIIKVDASLICSVALNGREALNLVRRKSCSLNRDDNSFCLILMDCNMPVMDGYEATKEIRTLMEEVETRDRPFICAVTGHVEEEYIKRCIDSGMDKVLQKPVPIIELRRILLQLKII